jgi:hypothetical protein
MRFAELNKRAEFRDRHRPCDTTIDVVTHLARLPGGQAPSSVWSRLRNFGNNLLTQQRGCFKQRTLGWVYLVVKLTKG